MKKTTTPASKRTIKRVLHLTPEEDAAITEFFKYALASGTWESDEDARKTLAREWKKSTPTKS